jgi:hypothetical protein
MLAPRPVPAFFPGQKRLDQVRDLAEAKAGLVVQLDNQGVPSVS